MNARRFGNLELIQKDDSLDSIRKPSFLLMQIKILKDIEYNHK